MPEAKHPIWGILRLLIMMTTLTLVLWATASKFDFTEIRTIVLMFIAGASYEGIGSLLTRKTIHQ